MNEMERNKQIDLSITNGFVEELYANLRKAYQEKETKDVRVEPRDLLQLLSKAK